MDGLMEGEKNMEGEVDDECLAALRAASEVIGEKCKFTPPPTMNKNSFVQMFLEDTPKGICWAIIGTIGAAINTIHFTEEKQEKYNFVDKGGMVTTVIKSELTNGTYKCDGHVSFYIKSKGFVDYMFQKLTRQPPKEIKETPEEVSVIVMPEEFPPTEELELYRMAIDLDGLGKEWKEVVKKKEKYLKILNKDVLIRDKKVEVMDFNISGVVIRPEQERTEADVEVAINAIAVKL